MNIKNVYILDDRAILYINGEDAKEFLQNLISNDINKVSDENSCFTSLLTPQGKFLYEFIIIKHKSGYLIDCEKSQLDTLFKQLNIDTKKLTEEKAKQLLSDHYTFLKRPVLLYKGKAFVGNSKEEIESAKRWINEQ